MITPLIAVGIPQYAAPPVFTVTATRERRWPATIVEDRQRLGRQRGKASIFAARMKSFSLRPPIACVQISMATCR